MFTALAQDGRKLTASEAAMHAKQNYFCPNCGSGVNLRNGLVKIEHFGHNPGHSCEYAGESLLHIQMKSQIHKNLIESIGSKVKNIELEKPLGNCRPDVFIEGRKKSIAIEVQASTLTPEQILNRTARYHVKGINVLWVVPYESDRITNSYRPGQQDYRTLRLKEYERIMSYLYFKTLVAWNVNRSYTKGFIVMKLKDAYGDGAEFYTQDGEYQSFDGKKLKMIKEIEETHADVQLPEFQPRSCKPFSMPMANYDLPARSIMVYDWRKR